MAERREMVRRIEEMEEQMACSRMQV